MTPEETGPGGSSAEELALAGARVIEAARESVVRVQSGGRRGGRAGGRGSGAGIIWGEDGLVMTNDHVVAGAGRYGRDAGLRVAARDGRTLDAEVVKRSRALDLALLRVGGDTGGLPAAHVGDSDALRVGALVFAIGYPWGFSGTVTSGVVSGLGVTRGPGGGAAGYVRSDVSLAPGNSGGPLLNARGEVVGINAMISGSQAFSVPSNAAALWASELRERRPEARLGVAVRPAGWRGARAEAGLILVAVEGGSPAERAGLMVGDVLLGAAGDPLADAETLLRVLARAGDAVSLGVRRGGRILSVEVSLTTSGPGQGPGRAA